MWGNTAASLRLLRGHEVYFKGLAKRYQTKEAWPGQPLGKDIISQIVTQDAVDIRATALAIITATKLHPSLEAIIEFLVRKCEGQVCIVREEQLMQILERHKPS
jgi:hypothetical protein